MLPRVAIALRRARIRAPVHAAPLPTLHGWDWHSVPERVRAKQRGADASRSGCMGLIVNFSISLSPRVIVELISNDGLPTKALHLAPEGGGTGLTRRLPDQCPARICGLSAPHCPDRTVVGQAGPVDVQQYAERMDR